MPHSRELDVVLFGATGFTGGLTAAYLAHHGPDGLRWGLAGRNLAKLEQVRDALGEAGAGVELIVADSGDPVALADLAARTQVVLSTVGPYVGRGEPLVGACADAGTDYCDITGEGEFVDRMYVAHHQTAVASGARLVHGCGFDSIPHDLGAMFTVEHLPADVPIDLRGVVRAGGLPSGGTFETALTGMSRVRHIREAAQARKRVEPRPEGRSSRAVAGKPHRDERPRLLAAAAAHHGPGDRRPQRRGPAVVRAEVPLLPLRRHQDAAVRRRRRRRHGRAGPGRPAQAHPGPADEVVPGRRRPRPRTAGTFVVQRRLRGRGGRRDRAHPRLRGDPGYTETAMMLAESGLCLAFDDNPEVAGQVTTAQAMGGNLLARVQAGGLKFEVR